MGPSLENRVWGKEGGAAVLEGRARWSLWGCLRAKGVEGQAERRTPEMCPPS